MSNEKMYFVVRYQAMQKPAWFPEDIGDIIMVMWIGFSLSHGAAAIMISLKNTPNEHWKCPMLFAFAIYLAFFYAWPAFFFGIAELFMVRISVQISALWEKFYRN